MLLLDHRLPERLHMGGRRPSTSTPLELLRLLALPLMNTAKLPLVFRSLRLATALPVNFAMAGFLSSTVPHPFHCVSHHLAAANAQQSRPFRPCAVARNRHLTRRRDIRYGLLVLLKPEQIQVHRRTPRAQANLYSRRPASVNHIGEWR